MVNPNEDPDRVPVRRRRTLPLHDLVPAATIAVEDADKAEAEWCEARYWAQRCQELMEGRQPADSAWPTKYKPSFPWHYTNPIFPDSERIHDFEIPFCRYVPPTVIADAGPTIPGVRNTIKQALAKKRSTRSRVLSEALTAAIPPHGCAMQFTGVYTRIAYTAVVECRHQDPEEGPSARHQLQIRCATISTNELDEYLQFAGKGDGALAMTGSLVCEHVRRVVTALPDKVRLELDEGLCAAFGVNFLLNRSSDQVYATEVPADNPNGLRISYPASLSNISPCLLVHVGIGASIYSLGDYNKITTVESIPLGGSSYMSMALLLTGSHDLDEFLELCESDEQVDLEGILGRGVGAGPLCQPAHDLDAFPFLAKAGTPAPAGSPVDVPHLEAGVSRERLALTILLPILHDIAQLAHHHAVDLSCDQVYFTGLFQRSRPRALNILTRILDSFGGTVRPRFLRHDAYVAALGALCVAERVSNRTYWDQARPVENFACSALPVQPLSSQPLVVFTIERLRYHSPCPLLESRNLYICDRDNLLTSKKDREAALEYMWNSVNHICTSIARYFQTEDEITTRIHNAKQRFRELLEHLWIRPETFGRLSTRALLWMREQCLFLAGIDDLFLPKKIESGNFANTMFCFHMQRVSTMKSRRTKYTHLCQFLIAGNAFDHSEWAVANDVNAALKSNEAFGNLWLKTANARCLRGEMNRFVKRLCLRKPKLKTVAVFLDSQGVDFVLGVLPFVLELLHDRITYRVMLMTNSNPNVNNFSFVELKYTLKLLGAQWTMLKDFIDEGRLTCHRTGLYLPGLDLWRLGTYLSRRIESCDLVILHGVNNAIHTNFVACDNFEDSFPRGMRAEPATFTCSVLRTAVVKSQFVANILQGRIYDYIFIYDEVLPSRKPAFMIPSKHDYAAIKKECDSNELEWMENALVESQLRGFNTEERNARRDEIAKVVRIQVLQSLTDVNVVDSEDDEVINE